MNTAGKVRNTLGLADSTRGTMAQGANEAAPAARALALQSAALRNIIAMRSSRRNEKGSVIILVAISLVVLIAMAGLAMDAGILYVTRQRAQAAADAAAQAAAMDIYNGTSSDLGSSNATWYARQNGFNTVNDTITVTYPVCSSLNWCNGHVTLSGLTPNLVQVEIRRVVNTTLLRIVGAGSSTIQAIAYGAIALSPSPVPILVIHPTLSGAFSTNGGNTITICGGPARSFMVNSTSPTSVVVKGGGQIDLSRAGPLDPGNCSAGTGADFANVGNEANPWGANLLLGTKPGLYIPKASAIVDPLLGVSPPSQPAVNGGFVTIAQTDWAAHNCFANIASPPNNASCVVYSPGYYATGINVKGSVFAMFRPGIYWINHGGFQLGTNGVARMATAAVDTSDPNTGTGWTSGMLVYNSPQAPVNANKDVFSISANSGGMGSQIFIDAANCPSGGNCITGSPALSSYLGILFFQDRTTATSLTHAFSGGGGLSVTGTIYITHTAANITADGTYQSVTLSGNSGGTTRVQGEIIADTLSLGGNSGITMNLIQTPIFRVREVALVQ